MACPLSIRSDATFFVTHSLTVFLKTELTPELLHSLIALFISMVIITIQYIICFTYMFGLFSVFLLEHVRLPMEIRAGK